MGYRHWFNTTLERVNLAHIQADATGAGFVCEGTANDLARGRIGLDLALETLTAAQRNQLAALINDHDPIDREAERTTNAVAGIADRYRGFADDDFLTIVGKIDNWATNLNAEIEAASTVTQVKAVVQEGFTAVATYLGPLLAYVYITRRQGE